MKKATLAIRNNTMADYVKMMNYIDKIAVKVIDNNTKKDAVLFVDNSFLTEDEEGRACIIHNNFMLEHVQQERFFKLYDYLEDTPLSVNFDSKEDLGLFEQFSNRENPNKFFINGLDDTFIFSNQFYHYCINNNDSKFFFELAEKCLGVLSDYDFKKIESNLDLDYTILDCKNIVNDSKHFVTIDEIEFFEDYQEVNCTLFDVNTFERVKSLTAFIQLPLCPGSIHTINDEATELANTIAELASESKAWRWYDSDEERLKRSIDRHTLRAITDDELLGFGCAYEYNTNLKFYETENKELLIAGIHNTERQKTIPHKLYDSKEAYLKDIEVLKGRGFSFRVGDFTTVYTIAKMLGFI